MRGNQRKRADTEEWAGEEARERGRLDEEDETTNIWRKNPAQVIHYHRNSLHCMEAL